MKDKLAIVAGFIIFVVFFYHLYAIHKERKTIGYKDIQGLLVQYDQLMSSIVNGVEVQPDEIERVARPGGSTYLKFRYDNPNVKWIERVEYNIANQQYWVEVPARVRDDNSIYKSYCFNEISLNLMRLSHFSERSSYSFKISMFWSIDSDCQKSVLAQQNAKKGN